MDRTQKSSASLLQFQVASWECGQPVSLETLFSMMSADDAELKLDLIYQEICRREEEGDEVQLMDYSSRFPDLAQDLPALFEVHEAMKRDFDLEGSVLEEPAAFQTRYTHLRELGSGGLGRVFLAVDTQLGRHVAIKKLRPEYCHSRHHNARFLREATLTAKLSHSSIIPVYDLGKDDYGEVYYSMKFIDGQTLDDITSKRMRSQFDWREHKFELRRLVSQLVSVCNGLKHAHERGVIHRDVKPANILIADGGEVLLVDWGVAGYVQRSIASSTNDTLDERLQAVKEDTAASGIESATQQSPASFVDGTEERLTVAGMRLGTPAFMSPEQLAAPESATPISDLYALGATLRYAITGTHHEQQTSAEIDDAAPALRGIPQELLAICDKATLPDPKARYSSVWELEQDLQNWLAGEPLLALPEGIMKKIMRWCAAHQRLVLTAMSLSVLLFVFAIVVVFQELRIQEFRNLQMEQQSLANRRLYRSAILAMANTDVLDSHAVFRDVPLKSDDSELRQAVHDHFLEMLYHSDPTCNPEIYVHLALSSLRLGDFSQALEYAGLGCLHLANAETSDERLELTLKAKLVQAEVHFRNSDFDAAIKSTDSGLESLNHSSTKFLHFRLAFELCKAMALLEQGELGEAKHLLYEVSAEQPNCNPFQTLAPLGPETVAGSYCLMRSQLALQAIHSREPFSFENFAFTVFLSPPMPERLTQPTEILLAPISELMQESPFAASVSSDGASY